jgi:hypothetical protein
MPEKNCTLGRDLPLFCLSSEECILKSDFEWLQNIDESQNMDIELAVRMVQTPTLSAKYEMLQGREGARKGTTHLPMSAQTQHRVQVPSRD